MIYNTVTHKKLFMNADQICNIIGCYRYKLHSMIKSGKFPDALKPNARSYKWFSCDVVKWVKDNMPWKSIELDKVISNESTV